MSSYFSFPIRESDGSIHKYLSKEVYFGLGYFVHMYNPQVKRLVTLGHMSEIDSAIPFSIPIYDKTKDIWKPINHQVLAEDIPSHPLWVKVKRGQIVGRLGFSGVRWGYDEYAPDASRPTVPDPNVYSSYDEPHVHFEDATRDRITGKKIWQRDPYDIYLTHGNYPTHKRKRNIGKESLFLLNSQGLPLFADE
jgi:hypothetical protein